MNSEKVFHHEYEAPAPNFNQLISEINSTEVTVYEKLNATNMDVARKEFLNDSSLTRPNYVYGNLNPEEVSHNLDTLDHVDNELDDNLFSEKQVRFARLISTDYRNANNFLAANITYNSAKTPEEKLAAAEYHHETNEILYGKPDENVFNSLLSQKLSAINVDQLSAEDRQLYQQLLHDLGDIESANAERFIPQPETIEKFSEMIHIFFDDLLSHIPKDQESFTPEEAANITNEIIREEINGISETDLNSEENFDAPTNYHAIVMPERASVSVDHTTRPIIFPGSRPKGDYTRKDLESIIIHEFGTHVYRALNYEHHELGALSNALPGNETWDDGVAKCVEQAIAGRYKDAGVDHYINIGLATFKNKNFREVFDLSVTIKFLSGVKPNETDEDRAARLEKARQTSFNPVQRCFRGTGELPNNKDLIYYNGTNQVWRYIEENIDDPDLFDHLFLEGKSVATDQNQAQLIYETKVGGL